MSYVRIIFLPAVTRSPILLTIFVFFLFLPCSYYS